VQRYFEKMAGMSGSQVSLRSWECRVR
jgi:hypothetical protein